MQIRAKNFPRRLLKKFVISSSVLFAICFSLLFFIFRWFFIADLEKLFPQVEWQGFLNSVFLIMLACAFLLFVGIMVFVYLELLIPLGVLYTRVKAIKEQREDEEEEDLSQTEPGEWSDLELAIGEIRERLKKSQRRFTRDKTTLQTLLNAIPEAIFAVDREGKTIFYNSSFLNLFGLNNHKIQDVRMSEFLRSPEIIMNFESTLRDQTTHRSQIKIHTEDLSKTKALQITVAPLKDTESERMYGAVCVFQDVTELKQLEQIRIDFVANVSHELRTPLTSVKGYAQTLMEDVKLRRFDQGEKFLEVIGRNVDRLLALVNDLLDLSSLDSGVSIFCEDIKTQPLTQNILDQLEPMRAKKEISISTDYEAETFWGDESRVQQVLVNLVQNAIQHIPPGNKIQISWMPVEDGVQMRVQDSGPGIGQEQLSRIFERFYRVDKARHRETGGTGLGLSIVKHIMQRHEGWVKAESKVGSGTTFICFFPKKKSEL